jgi:hypothetical protein
MRLNTNRKRRKKREGRGRGYSERENECGLGDEAVDFRSLFPKGRPSLLLRRLPSLFDRNLIELGLEDVLALALGLRHAIEVPGDLARLLT